MKKTTLLLTAIILILLMMPLEMYAAMSPAVAALETEDETSNWEEEINSAQGKGFLPDTDNDVRNKENIPIEPAASEKETGNVKKRAGQAVDNWRDLAAAVSAVQDGAVIPVGDINFEGVLAIDKSLTFHAEGAQAKWTSAPFTRHLSVSGSDITLTFENVILDGNKAGGGIESKADTLTLYDVQVENCFFQISYNNSPKGAIYVGDACRLVIGGNSRIQDNAFQGTSYGGGIFAGNRAVVELADHTVVQGNEATYGAGVRIEDDSSLIVRESAQITHNKAQSGGGVSLGSLSAVTVFGSVSYNESTINNGGGIHYSSISNDTTKGCIITIDGGKVNHNIGGAIMAKKGASNGKQFENTINIQNGGEVCYNTTSRVPAVSCYDLHVYDGKINENVTTQIAPSTINVIEMYFYEGEIVGNRAENVERGIIWPAYALGTTVFCHDRFYMEGGLIGDNGIDLTTSVSYIAGTVYVHGSEVAITGGTFRGNAAMHGSAASYGGALAIQPFGGASMKRVTVNIENAVFSDNKVSWQGGAIHCAPPIGDGVTFSVKNCTFENNTAGRYGGALFLSAPKDACAIEDSTFRENTAERGAVYSNCKTLAIKGGAFIGNEAGSNDDGGGGIFNDGMLEIGGALFRDNMAAGGLGGAIYNRDGVVKVMDDVQFTGNGAGQGGAIYTEKLSDVTVSGANFSENIAPSGLLWNVNDPTQPPELASVLTDAANLYRLCISDVTATQPFTNIYNNFDINFPHGGNIEGTTVRLEYYDNDLNSTPIGEKSWNTYIGAPLPVAVAGHLNDYQPTGYGPGHLTGSYDRVMSGLVLHILYQPVTYHVSYQANAPDAFTGITQDTNAYTMEELATVLKNSFICNGYRFVSWNTAPDGQGSRYNPGDTLTVKGDITLYAQWRRINPGTPPEPQPVPELNKEDHVAYVVGFPDKTVKPGGDISRAETVTIFFRLLKQESREEYWAETNSYYDVTGSAWYHNAVSTMENAKLIKGYEDGSFRGNRPVTRAEFAALAARFDSGSYEGDEKFSDINTHWAREYINRAVQNGWITGYPDGTFKPDKNITRAEAMTLVNHMLGHDRIKEMHEDMITWPDNTKDQWYYKAVQEATNSHKHKTDSNGDETWVEMQPAPDWSLLERK